MRSGAACPVRIKWYPAALLLRSVRTVRARDRPKRIRPKAQLPNSSPSAVGDIGRNDGTMQQPKTIDPMVRIQW